MRAGLEPSPDGRSDSPGRIPAVTWKSPGRNRRQPQPGQLVFPFGRRLGVVVFEDGARAEVVGLPESMRNGKTTRAWLRRQGETVQREAVWEAWRRLRVVRKVAA